MTVMDILRATVPAKVFYGEDIHFSKCAKGHAQYAIVSDFFNNIIY